jgi:hypothetical protein
MPRARNGRRVVPDSGGAAMTQNSPRLALLALAALVLAPAAHACGEGRFDNGGGLAYQAYLAPRPATVLILDEAEDAKDQSVYAGLQRAGHRVTVVHDTGALAATLAAGGVDVVIGGMDAIADLHDTTAHRLPVVARSERNSPQVRAHFDTVLVDGASLRQYLKVIHHALDGAR